MRPPIFQGMVLLFMGLTAACADAYTCGAPSRAGCHSVSRVYRETGAGFVDYREAQSANDEAASSPGDPPTNVASPSSAANPRPGDPLLTPAKVLRVLLNSWEDQDKDFHVGEFIFVRLEEPRWVLSAP